MHVNLKNKVVIGGFTTKKSADFPKSVSPMMLYSGGLTLRGAWSQSGFTLIELLVVIAIIGLLSTLAIVALGSVRLKARDARRAADIEAIFTALNMYFDDHGCLPHTSSSTCPGAEGYSERNAGAWDYSSQGGFMQFLVNGGYMSKVPLDPINNMTGDSSPTGTYAYRYYCYWPGDTSGGYPMLGVYLGYKRESDDQWVIKNQRTSSTNWGDAMFLCK